MVNQTIPGDDAQITNVVPESWVKGDCPPSWQEPPVNWIDADNWVDEEVWND